MLTLHFVKNRILYVIVKLHYEVELILKKRGVRNNVRSRRRALDITQDELAKKAEVTRQTIIAIEKERYEPTIGVALLISKALGDSVENLFYLEDDEQED